MDLFMYKEEMNNLDKVKKHMKKRKVIYISLSTGFVFAGITYLIMIDRHAGVPRVPDGPDVVTVRPLSFFSKQSVVTVVEREGRGHPGYIIQCLETGDVFKSQSEAAKCLGTYPSIISGHLNGKLTDVFGYHLERLNQ